VSKYCSRTSAPRLTVYQRAMFVSPFSFSVRPVRAVPPKGEGWAHASQLSSYRPMSSSHCPSVVSPSAFTSTASQSWSLYASCRTMQSVHRSIPRLVILTFPSSSSTGFPCLSSTGRAGIASFLARSPLLSTASLNAVSNPCLRLPLFSIAN